MPKKKIENETPKVTNIPLPVSDNPLVIDLPDGQKIVVGKLQTGSVIEVATWRGTGRPDSRTSRLMMGMNTGKSEPAEKVETDTQKKPEEGRRNQLEIVKQKTMNLLKMLISNSMKLLSKGKKLFQSSRREIQKPVISSTQTKPIAAPSADVDEWLAKIIEKSERRRELETRKNQVAKKQIGKQRDSRPVKAKKPQPLKSKKSR